MPHYADQFLHTKQGMSLSCVPAFRTFDGNDDLWNATVPDAAWVAGKDRDVTATVKPFMNYKRNGLDLTIHFTTKLSSVCKSWNRKPLPVTSRHAYMYTSARHASAFVRMGA
jgi:hypothetical protein